MHTGIFPERIWQTRSNHLIGPSSFTPHPRALLCLALEKMRLILVQCAVTLLLCYLSGEQAAVRAALSRDQGHDPTRCCTALRGKTHCSWLERPWREVRVQGEWGGEIHFVAGLQHLVCSTSKRLRVSLHGRNMLHPQHSTHGTSGEQQQRARRQCGYLQLQALKCH